MPLIFEKPETLLPTKETTITAFYWSSSLLRHRHREAMRPRAPRIAAEKKDQLFNNKNYYEKNSPQNNYVSLNIIAETLQQVAFDLSGSALMPTEAYSLFNKHPMLGSGVFHYSQNYSQLQSKFTKINSNVYSCDFSKSNFLLALTSVYATDTALLKSRRPRKLFFDSGIIAGHLKLLCKSKGLLISENLSFYDFELIEVLGINPEFELPIVLFSID